MLTRSFFSALSALVFAAFLPSTAIAQGTERISVDSAGNESYFFPFEDPAISADGQFVVFVSSDFGLVAGDTNGVSDIFVRDRAAGLTTRVSVDSTGLEGNNTSYRADISGDGRYVTFASYANNLVAGDTNGQPDIFLHDRLTGTTSRISVDSVGTQANSASEKAEISADGTTVVFYSFASNLVASDTNGASDCFVHEIASGATTRVSVSSSGAQSNSVSGNFFPDINADGRFVAFDSNANNLVAADTNGAWDTFVHDRLTGATTRVSVTSGGVQASGSSFYPSISDDGNVVGFYSFASDLVAADTNGAQDCFVHDRTTGVTRRVSVDSAGVEGVYDSNFPVVAGDGSSVVFFSLAPNLVAGDTNSFGDIFVHDLSSGVTTRASLADSGAQANNGSTNPDISANGQFVAFGSYADNLVVGDANGLHDVFVRDRGAVSPGPNLSVSGACGGVMDFDVTGATPGGVVAFVSGPPGVFVKPGPPCTGLTLDVSPPTLRAMIVADAAGNASVRGMFVPAGACGLGVQAVDVATCTPTGMVVL
jgi:WD40 repeat protein